jgi:Domain of unknown function (DUF5666)
MQTPTNRRSNRGRWARCLGGGATVLVTLAAASTAAGGATTSNRPAGASGSVAALSSSSMEVQNPTSGQTTVSWTSTTAFSKTVSEAVGSLAVGDCVSATGTASKKSKTTIAARSVTVTTPSSSGSCARLGQRFGAGGTSGATSRGFAPRSGGGFPGGGFEGGGPSGSRPNFPGAGSGSSNFRKELASLSTASGKVTAVHGTTVTISGTKFSFGSLVARGSTSSKTTSKKPPTPKPEKLTITTSKSTTVSATQSATSSDLAVGDCVSAFGPAASTGAVTASTVRITSTGGRSCTVAGRGGFFGGGFPGGGFPGGGSGA